MTTPPAIRSRIRAAEASAAFALAFGVGAALTGNQNSYLLHAAARAGWGRLPADWAARTLDPFPVFTALAAPLLHAAPGLVLGVAQLLAIAIYACALVAIVRITFGWGREEEATAAIFLVLLACHSRALASVSMRAAGVDARALLVDGVASQYLLGRVLQPSVAGVFLLVSIYAFLRGRPLLAVVCSSVAATVHATYFLSAALLTVSYAAALARRGERGRALAIAASSLALVAPAALYAATTFRPTDPATFQRAARILGDDRIALHARVATWFGAAALAKAALCCGALWVVRRRAIFALLWPALLAGAIGSLLLAAFPDPALALQFPWRVSVWLVPISTALLAGAAIDALGRWRADSLGARRLKIGGLVVAALLVAYGIGGSVREARAVDRRADGPLRAYVAAAASTGDVYLIPPDLEDFRLRTRTPIVVDAKTHPYKDVEVVQWNGRLQQTRAFYAETDAAARCSRLGEIARRDGATRVVVLAAQPIACPGVERIYADDAFSVFAISR